MARRTDGTTLVLGGSGFLGTRLLRAALDGLDGRIVAAGRFLDGAPEFLRAERRALIERIDARDLRSLEALLDRLRPEWILNAAALARAVECERSPDAAELLNAELPRHLARWSGRAGARLVHVSTDLVFGAQPAPEGGFREEHAPQPLGIYGETKARGEAAVLAEHAAALVVRLPLLYGDSNGRELGASDSLLAAVARGEQPALFVDEWRTPLWVEDAAQALVELAGGATRGVLHVAGLERASRFELGLAVLAARGIARSEARALVRPIRRADHAGPSRAEDTSLDAHQALAMLATPLRGLADGLCRAVARDE